MEGRKWEELPSDCLVNVFTRVGIEALIYDVPFVCKHWYKATRNPLCWQEIVFFDISTHPIEIEPKYEILVRPRRPLTDEHLKVYFSEMLKYAIDRSSGLATRLWLPSCCTKEALVYAAEKCPNLKSLGVARVSLAFIHDLKFLIRKWENLEFMLIGHCLDLIAIFIEVKRLENFESLVLLGCKSYEIVVIGGHFPNIKSLAIFDSNIYKKDLVTVLKSCSKLVHCTISGHFSFEVDDEILALARRISTFEYHAFTIDPSLVRSDPYVSYQSVEDDYYTDDDDDDDDDDDSDDD